MVCIVNVRAVSLTNLVLNWSKTVVYIQTIGTQHSHTIYRNFEVMQCSSFT